MNNYLISALTILNYLYCLFILTNVNMLVLIVTILSILLNVISIMPLTFPLLYTYIIIKARLFFKNINTFIRIYLLSILFC